MPHSGRGRSVWAERTSPAALPNIEKAVTFAETFLQVKPPLQSGETNSAPPIPLLLSADAALLSAKCTSCAAQTHVSFQQLVGYRQVLACHAAVSLQGARSGRRGCCVATRLLGFIHNSIA